ncbi:MAG: serine/threonine protein kinase [Bryobacterales bacterium]|nr:serine/threonine protein kinase [Bryobacterales bacterium]
MERASADRAGFLDGACGGDAELRAEVESLLRASEGNAAILDQSPIPQREAQRHIPAGLRIGDYEVGDKLGEGGMGMVFQAFDTKLKRRVAIKVMHAGDHVHEDRRRQFLQEARAASALNHPNIITIHDLLRHEDAEVIVMEYVEGELLSEMLERGPMEVEQMIPIASQIASALEATHNAGIVHRDLKPGNVLIRRDGIVKVLDFGAATLLGPSDGTGQPFPGAVLGTPSYMSPEQTAGSSVDTRSDIFSFGSMLYEMAAGRKAFPGETVWDAAQAVRKMEPTPIESGPPSGLARLIHQCLRKDPGQRVQSMAEVRIALKDLAEGLEMVRILSQIPEWTSEPTPAPRQNWVQRLWRKLRG